MFEKELRHSPGLVDIPEIRENYYFLYFAAYQVGGFGKAEIARAIDIARGGGKLRAKPESQGKLNSVRRAIAEVSKLIGLKPRPDVRHRKSKDPEREAAIQRLAKALKEPFPGRKPKFRRVRGQGVAAEFINAAQDQKAPPVASATKSSD